jgi:hypothetical protein
MKGNAISGKTVGGSVVGTAGVVIVSQIGVTIIKYKNILKFS